MKWQWVDGRLKTLYSSQRDGYANSRKLCCMHVGMSISARTCQVPCPCVGVYVQIRGALGGGFHVSAGHRWSDYLEQDCRWIRIRDQEYAGASQQCCVGILTMASPPKRHNINGDNSDTHTHPAWEVCHSRQLNPDNLWVKFFNHKSTKNLPLYLTCWHFPFDEHSVSTAENTPVSSVTTSILHVDPLYWLQSFFLPFRPLFHFFIFS